MTEETSKPEATPEAPTEAPKRGMGIYDLLQALKSGKTDPLMALLLMSELRRMERDEERWNLERQRLLSNPQKEIDVEKLVKELNETWEKRFHEYQSNLEKLLLGKKAEEAEERAERLEKELKETREKIEQEKLLKEKVEEALAPYKEQINQLQQLLASKTASMTESEKRSFFQNLGEQIERSISEEVTGTIAKTVADAITKAFTPKEEETPTTPEGKPDWYRMVDKWVKRGLDTLKAVAERWPTAKPPIKEVQKIPVTTPPTPPTSIPGSTATTAAPPQPLSISATPSPTTPAEEVEIPKIEKGEKAVESKTEKEPETVNVEPSQEATGERTESQEPRASD